MAMMNLSDDGRVNKSPVYVRPAAVKLPMNFMPEQLAVIESTEGSIKVRAGAGTGKTTTLTGYAARRPNESILYVAFNAAIASEAAGKFTPNVVCRTTHSIAHSAMNVRQVYGHKLAPGVKAKQISNLMGVPFWAATLALNTINAFLYSKDTFIDNKHAVAAFAKPEIVSEIVRLATDVWGKMIDPYNKSVSITHDGYLKLFHLSGKRLGSYGTVMMDEAQDTNPVTSAIVAGHAGNKVYVGDRNQSIYAFRGAENAMDSINAREYMLSSSFRFGSKVADVANTILHHTLGDTARIKGLGPESKINSANLDAPYALLSRTNGTLFERAVIGIGEGRRVAIVGGPESLKLSMLIDTYRLHKQIDLDMIKTPSILQFKNYDEMEELVSDENTGDMELRSLCRAVNKFGNQTPKLANMISDKCSSAIDGADIVLSTAHKSKGLEFDTVVLADDFRNPGNEEGIEIQEGNLLYVAVTRAKKHLVLNQDMNSFMSSPRDNASLVQEKMRKFNRPA